jgi:two-component system, NarL family, response regulator NreC
MIRILMVDDHPVVRSGISMLLNAQSDMQVVGETSTQEEALKLIPECQPNVITVDIDLAKKDGLQMIPYIQQQFPTLRCLVLTMHNEPAYFKQAVLAGAAGYVVKAAAEQELLTAIRTINSGMTYFHLSVAAQQTATVESQNTETESPMSGLTEREREVLSLVASGHTSQEIGQQLFLSRKTIETYRARLMQKLGVSKRADLVKYAIQNGILTAASPPNPHLSALNTTSFLAQ